MVVLNDQSVKKLMGSVCTGEFWEVNGVFLEMFNISFF